jgi:hypothetical protein
VSALGPRAGGLRTIRIALVLIAFGVMLNTVGVVVSFVLNADRVDQINDERLRNTQSSCERESGQNAAIMSFLRQRHASGDTLKDAEKFFPVRKPGECVRVARRQVSNP